MKKVKVRPNTSSLSTVTIKRLGLRRDAVLKRLKRQDRFLLGMTVAVGLTSLLWLGSMLINSDASWSNFLTLGALLSVITLALRLPFSFYPALSKLAFVGVLGLAAATLASFVMRWVTDGSFVRIKLGFSSPVVLAASLLSGCLAYVTLNRKGSNKQLVYGVTALAILVTASRMAFIAFCISGLLSLLMERTSLIRIVMLSLGLGVLSTILTLSHSSAEPSRNLLRDSAGFDKDYWKKPGVELRIMPAAVPGPNGSGQAYAISAKPEPEKTVLLLQHAGTSSSQLRYVASIYLRADTPTQIILSTPLGRTVCQVTMSWRRCVTPATPGNDRTTAQLRLTSLNAGQELTFYAWGAQLEVSDKVTALEVKDPARTGFINRFDSSNFFAIRESASVRLKLMNAAWQMFQTAPLAGVGSSQFQDTLATMNSGDPVVTKRNHAHNLWLHTLATQGLLGGLGLAILFLTPLFIVKRFWRQWLPLVVGMVLINMVDIVFFSGVVALGYWLALTFIWITHKPNYLSQSIRNA